MRIAVIGCGAMGSLYAALLADAGNEVLVVHRGLAHVEAIQARGLRVEGASGDRTVRIAASTEVPNRVVDLIIIAVKAAQVAEVAVGLQPLIGPATILVTLQNGVGSADILAKFVPVNRLCLGIAGGFGAIMRAPGHAYHNGMNVIRLGAYADLPLQHVERVAAIWRAAGFKTEAVADVLAMQWEKLICNVAYSAPCALTGLTVGAMMDDPDMGPISREAATEAWMVARALGIKITVEDPIASIRAFAAGMPAAKPSLLQDLENRRLSEIDVINGAVPRAASSIGMKAPVNATLVALVKQRERSF